MTEQERQQNQQQILDFLKDKNKKQLLIEYSEYNYKTLFYKVSLGVFDYVYLFDYINNDVINIEHQYSNDFACVIDTRYNKIYFELYGFYKFFEYYDTESQKMLKNKEYEALKGKTKEELTEEINNRLYQEILNIAENVNTNSLEYDYYNWQRQNSERMFYLNETNKIYNFLHKEYIDYKYLLQYIQDKDNYINNVIANKEVQERVQQEKAYYNARERFLKEIETSEEYKYFRLAKQIKDSIPENAKQVTLFYKKNDEIIQCKYEAKEFERIPYYVDKPKDIHYCKYGLSNKDRAKIDEDIYVMNIAKITYNGKTIYKK